LLAISVAAGWTRTSVGTHTSASFLPIRHCCNRHTAELPFATVAARQNARKFALEGLRAGEGPPTRGLLVGIEDVLAAATPECWAEPLEERHVGYSIGGDLVVRMIESGVETRIRS
jgi:hypothetical protein